jgi:hypothetical protein
MPSMFVRFGDRIFPRIDRLSPITLPRFLTPQAPLNNPSIPIVGENGKEPNDTYLPQLNASAAAVNQVVKRDVAALPDQAPTTARLHRSVSKPNSALIGKRQKRTTPCRRLITLTKSKTRC